MTKPYKYYPLPNGGKGLVNGKYMMFASESDYKDYLEED